MTIDSPGEIPLSLTIPDPPNLNLDDPRYPRKPSFTLLCKVLRLSWLAFGFYLGIVIPVLITDAIQRTLNPESILAALLIYGTLQQHPLLVSGCLVAAGLFVALGRWADRDLKRAHAISLATQARKERQRIMEQLRRSLDLALRNSQAGAVDAPTIYGPPFDTLFLPVPEHVIGREHEDAWLLKRLGDSSAGATSPSLVTALNGMDGIGKTTLAGLAVRRLKNSGRYPDGIAVVRCERIDNSAEVLAKTIARFHPNRREPQITTADQLAEEARASLRGKKALIVFDNVEPTLNLSEVVAPLQDAQTPVLLTSWQKPDERVVPHTASHKLAELSRDDALELFARSYGLESAADFEQRDRAVAERIIALLRYHTYSITLIGAAARDEGRPLRVFAAELEKDLGSILEMRDHERQRAIAKIIEQSAGYLSEDAHRLLVALAAFGTEEFARNAVIALCAALSIPAPADSIHLLILRNLIEASTNSAVSESGDLERLRLHPLLRAYVLETFQRSFSPEDQQRAYGAVAAYYAQYAARVEPRVQAFDENNIIAALEWARDHGQSDLIIALTAAMSRFWSERWRTAEALRYFPGGIAAAQAFADATGAYEDQVRVADLELAFGQILQNIGRLNEADAMLNTNMAIRRRLGDKAGEGRVALQLGELAMLRGNPEEARKHFAEVLEVFGGPEGSTDKETTESVLCYLGELEVMRGHLASGMEYFERSMALCHERDDAQGKSTLLAYEGDIARLRGDIEAARGLYEHSLRLARQTQDSRGEADCLAKLGNIAFSVQRLEEADTYYQQAHEICQSIQDRPGLAAIYNLMGRVLQARGHLDEAERRYAASLEIAHETQNRRREGILTADLGRLAEARGNLDKAMDCYRQAVNLSAYSGDYVNVAATTVAFGELLKAHPERVAQGCVTLMRNLQLCDGTDLPDTQKGREIARQLGCA